jgi:endonuclease/exonuclease/phosphatase family metal-dependent hydrolase
LSPDQTQEDVLVKITVTVLKITYIRALFAGKVLLLSVTLLGSACSKELSYPAPPQTGVARSPEVTIDESTNTASMEVSVLIYNVCGLPWPIAKGKTSRDTDDQGNRIPIDGKRSSALKKIGDMLGELRNQGTEPDIILLQEAFISESEQIPQRGGYPNWVAGPGKRDLGPKHSERASEEFIAERKALKGEKSGKLQSSGLLLASNFPIVELFNHPFSQWECAGFDCLANKGLLVAELEIPGLPEHLMVATTHFNSRGASGVSAERSLLAHNLQVDEANQYLVNLGKDHQPFIWGGDVNMRHADDRIEYFVERSGDKLNEVSSFCVNTANDCEVRIQWDSDTPWYETQDLQGWVSGSRVSVSPFKVEAVFDEPQEGIMPSDHNGLLVHYRLSWPIPVQ